MSLDPSSLESELQHLRPAALDAALLARLEACAAGTWTAMDPAANDIAHELQQLTPAKLPPALLASLEAATATLPFPGEENIVRFSPPPTAAPRSHRTWWRAAAAVALIGAASALLMPAPHSPAKLTAQATPTPRSSPPARQTTQLVPASFNRDLAETRDEGVIWQSNDQPHRVLKVVYSDRVTLKDAAGKPYQIEQPRVEYILVPAKTD